MFEPIKKTVPTDENGYFPTLVEVAGGPGITRATVTAEAGGGAKVQCNVETPSTESTTASTPSQSIEITSSSAHNSYPQNWLLIGYTRPDGSRGIIHIYYATPSHIIYVQPLSTITFTQENVSNVSTTIEEGNSLHLDVKPAAASVSSVISNDTTKITAVFDYTPPEL
jgi:hypothetical protein